VPGGYREVAHRAHRFTAFSTCPPLGPQSLGRPLVLYALEPRGLFALAPGMCSCGKELKAVEREGTPGCSSCRRGAGAT